MDRMARTAIRRASAAMAIAAAAAVSGCADLKAVTDFRPLPVDPASPVAADVEKAQTISGPIPSFASIPPKPTDIRPAEAYKGQVVNVVGDRRGLAQWEAANPAINTDTEAFAASQRAKLAGETPVSPAQQKESEEFARKLREAAHAPTPK